MNARSIVGTPAAPGKPRPSMGPPDRFVRKPRRAMRISRTTGTDSIYLPFEAKTANHDAPNWNVPATGGVYGGIETGAYLAFAVMKQRRAEPFQKEHQFQLFEIVCSMMERDRQLELGTDEHITFTRQVKSFLSTITRAMDYYLSAEAEVHDILDGTSMEELLDGANRGLGLDSEKYAAWLREPKKPAVLP
jgi:hypothetical protein